jgi:protein-glutamine gamma-glutamyltransferase
MSPTIARIREINARRPPEESAALRAAVTIAVVAAATATLRQGVGGTLLTIATVAGIPGAMIFSHVTRHREGFLLKVLLALGILAAFGQFLVQVTRLRTGVAADVQIPLAELFLWTQLLHSFDVPARRDLQYSLVSSLVLIGVGGVLSISMSYGLHLIVWAVAATASIVLMHRSELNELPRLSRPRPVGGPPVGRLLRPVLGTLAAIVVLGAVAFSFVPPAGTARALAFPSLLPEATGAVPVPGGLSNPTLGDDDPANEAAGDSEASSGPQASFGYFGFADELDTATRGRPDNTLVMRVRSSAADFWRGQSFDHWDGRQWTFTDDRVRRLQTETLPIQIPPTSTEVGVEGSQLVQTFYLEGIGPNLIFGAYTPDEVYFADRQVFQLPDGTLRTGVELGPDTVYTVVSIRPPSTPDLLRRSSSFLTQIPRPIAEPYLQLPKDMPLRIAELARQVTANAPTAYDKVRALESWMGANTTYTLDIPPLPRGADAVEQYLFVDRQGFCEQIGTSLVVMLRSLGIPARLAVGYAAGTRNPFTGMYEVRASDAHAWAEVWFPGIGWQGFDPTAEVPLAGDPGPQSAASGLAAYLDFKLPQLPDNIGQSVVLVAVAGTVLGVGAWVVSAVMSRRRAARRPWATRFLDRVEIEGRARGKPRHPAQTGPEYLRALGRTVLSDARFGEVAHRLEAEVYGGQASSAEERQQAERVLVESAARWPAG